MTFHTLVLAKRRAYTADGGDTYTGLDGPDLKWSQRQQSVDFSVSPTGFEGICQREGVGEWKVQNVVKFNVIESGMTSITQ